MKTLYEQYLVSPTTHQPLTFRGSEQLVCETDTFDVVQDIPVLLPKNTAADWRRELIELILWEHPDQIEIMRQDIDFQTYDDPARTYIKWIKKLIGGKEEIIRVLERYEASDTKQWIIDRKETIDEETMESFHRINSPDIAKKRVESKYLCEGAFLPYFPFSTMTVASKPQAILELATGAGGGTAAVALRKDKDTVMFSVDIGFGCLGNAVAIGNYLGCRDTLLPVCANFWYLPFACDSMDAVCTFCGLDESRENDKTIAEVARVLKTGGKFVCVSRENAFMRQGSVLESFGFTKDETVYWLKRCRMYSDVESLKEMCAAQGLRFVTEERSFTSNGVVFVTTQFKKE